MIGYTVLSSMPPLDEPLRDALLKEAFEKIKNNLEISNFPFPNETNPANAGYTLTPIYPDTGSVNLYSVSNENKLKLSTIYNLPIGEKQFYLQATPAGTYIAPHIDFIRTSSYVNFLDTGGQNVINFWWKLKDEWASKKLSDVTAIPHERLLLQTMVQLKQNTWYQFSHDIIHSVVNLTSPRIAIVYFDNCDNMI